MIVAWSVEALENLESLHRYVASDSPRYADLLVERICDAVVQLETFPQSGRIVPEYSDPSLRELIVGNYRIIYYIEPDQTVVVTVHHSARRLDKE